MSEAGGARADGELYTYDAFGNQVTGATTGQPFRYTGRRYDEVHAVDVSIRRSATSEEGLYYYRARYYSSDLGRFLQTDPIGYEDNMNMYAYVGNDPLNNTDPSGMSTCDGKKAGHCSGGGDEFSQSLLNAVAKRKSGFAFASASADSSSKAAVSGSSQQGAETPVRGFRHLNQSETSMLRKVFGNSVNYESVKLYRKKYIFFQRKNRVMAPNGNIYFPSKGPHWSENFANESIHSQSLLVHEITHVWQHQQGVNVAGRGIFERKYDYEPTAGKAFNEYNIEQQGQIVQDYFYIQNGYTSDRFSPRSWYESILPF